MSDQVTLAHLPENQPTARAKARAPSCGAGVVEVNYLLVVPIAIGCMPLGDQCKSCLPEMYYNR